MKLDLSRPLIYLITTGQSADRTFETDRKRLVSVVGGAIDLDVQLVQLREKNLSGRNLYLLALELSAMCRGTTTRLLINDRADIAAPAGADGVHLTSRSLSAAAVRKAFGPQVLIGVSTHSSEEISANRPAADFALFGPVFKTPEKPDAQGTDVLRDVCREHNGFPILAVGGVDADNLRTVLANGAAGIAAIRALNDRPSLERIVAELRNG